MQVKFDIPLTGKNLLTLVGAMAVFAETLIALLVPPDHLGWSRWRASIIIIGVAGIAALIWQAVKQSREDSERERREQGRDEQIRRITEDVSRLLRGPSAPTPVASDPTTSGVETARDPVFDGELERVFISPRMAVPYKMLQEIWQLSNHTEPPKVDCDILVAMWFANVSSSVQYVRDLTASVEVGGERRDLERTTDFKTRFSEEPNDFEYGFEAEKDEEPTALKPLLPELPCELTPNQPRDGWIRFVLKNVAPDAVDSSSWQFGIIDSRGNPHFITRTSVKPRKGEIGYRNPRHSKQA